jgi:hypothetical protein
MYKSSYYEVESNYKIGTQTQITATYYEVSIFS